MDETDPPSIYTGTPGYNHLVSSYKKLIQQQSKLSTTIDYMVQKQKDSAKVPNLRICRLTASV